jgi:hypothetical protein
MKNVCDVTEPFKGELQYEIHACNLSYSIMGCSKSYENNNTYYCQYCWSNSDIFGCFGLRRKKHCILNKQYTPEEYFNLIPKIIDHMRNTKEWSEFFPLSHSTYAYNETVANEYFPLKKEEALQKGLKWHDDLGLTPQPRDDVQNCSKCHKNFILIPQEIEFYKKMNLDKPTFCFNCRHEIRFNLRPPRKLINRTCSQCGSTTKSCYSTEKANKIMCENCYLKTVY